jgi:hypothetical protein
VSFLLGALAAAQSVDLQERWAGALKETDRFLVAGEPERARRILSQLVREIVEASRPSDQVDARAYGEPGELLRRNSLPAVPERCAQAANSPLSPSIAKRREPDYPSGALRFAFSGILVVQIEVDASGRPLRPQVIRKQAGPLVHATLDALGEWRFERKPNSPDLPFCVVFQYRN